MKKNSITIILIVFIANIIFLNYFSDSNIIKLNDGKYEINIKNIENIHDFLLYIEINEIDVQVDAEYNEEYHTFISESYIKRTGLDSNKNCFTDSFNFYFSEKTNYCKLNMLPSFNESYNFINDDDFTLMKEYLTRNNIEYSVTSFNYILETIDYTIIFIIMAILLMLLFLFDAQHNLKVKAILKLSGYSTLEIILKYFKIIFLVSTLAILLILLFDAALIIYSTQVSEFTIFVKNFGLNFIVISFGIYFLYFMANLLNNKINILKILKGKISKPIVFTLIFTTKLLLSASLIAIVIFSVIEVYEVIGDFSNKKHWDKYEDYYKIGNDDYGSDTFSKFVTDNYDNIIYFDYYIPSDYESYQTYCVNEKKSITYCHEVRVSKLFYHDLSLDLSLDMNEYNYDLLVLVPEIHENDIEVIKNEHSIMYPELDLFYISVDDYKLYSYDTGTNILNRDYIIEPLIVIDVKGTLANEYYENLNNAYIYSSDVPNITNYVIDSDDIKGIRIDESLKKYYEDYFNIKVFRALIIILVTFIGMALLNINNNYFINQTINFTIEKSIVMKTNGFSNFDIYYFIYSFVIFVYMITAFLIYLMTKSFIDLSYVLLVLSGVFIILDCTMINHKINKIEKTKIVEFLKGGRL